MRSGFAHNVIPLHEKHPIFVFKYEWLYLPVWGKVFECTWVKVQRVEHFVDECADLVLIAPVVVEHLVFVEYHEAHQRPFCFAICEINESVVEFER